MASVGTGRLCASNSSGSAGASDRGPENRPGGPGESCPTIAPSPASSGTRRTRGLEPADSFIGDLRGNS